LDNDPDRDTKISDKPEPPPGQGPVLAWYRNSKHRARRLAIYGTIAVMVLLYFAEGFNVRVFEIWWEWLLAIGAGVGIYFSTKAEWCSAGADWFSFQKSWAKTYELTEIKTRYLGGTTIVYLTDADGHKIDAPLNVIQEDRLIWDLLYNGVRHSIANGAVIKGAARYYFPVG
jgi:hypothetical protein